MRATTENCTVAIVVMSLQSILGVVIQVNTNIIIINYQQLTGGGSADGGGGNDCGGNGGDDYGGSGGDDSGGKMNTFLFPPSALSAF